MCQAEYAKSRSKKSTSPSCSSKYVPRGILFSPHTSPSQLSHLSPSALLFCAFYRSSSPCYDLNPVSYLSVIPLIVHHLTNPLFKWPPPNSLNCPHSSLAFPPALQRFPPLLLSPVPPSSLHLSAPYVLKKTSPAPP